MERQKCIVLNCTNHTDEGGFVGVLCFPCYDFITTNDMDHGKFSQAGRNAINTAIEILKGANPCKT